MSRPQGKFAMTSVLIVDDHPAVRDALSAEIARHCDLSVCGEAADISTALRLVESTHPDIAVIDISLKAGGNGIDLIKRIKSKTTKVKILVWSMFSESLYAERALEAGASGYLNKEQATDEIVTAIRMVRDGQLYISREMANRLMMRGCGKRKPDDISGVKSLSNRELEVFDFIGHGLSTREIADRLHLSVHTIETHRQRIKFKLVIDSSSQLARRAAQWVLENS